MGQFDEYCLICGCPITIQALRGQIEFGEIKEKIKITTYLWLTKVVIVTSENKIIKANGNQYTDYGSFNVKGVYIATTQLQYKNPKNTGGYGVCCHEACYKLLQKELGYKLKFTDVHKLLIKTNSIMKPQAYGKEIAKFTGAQDFNFTEVLSKFPWLIESPVKNEKNKVRILKIWQLLVKKFKPQH